MKAPQATMIAGAGSFRTGQAMLNLIHPDNLEYKELTKAVQMKNAYFGIVKTLVT